MLVGIDGSRAFIKDKTGTENYSYQLIKALAKIDAKNTQSLRFADAKRNYLIYIKKSQISNFKAQKWPGNFKFQIINFKFLWTQAGLALRTFLDPLDVLFIPSHTLPLIRRPGLKTILTVHDLGAEYLPAYHQLKQILYLKLMTYYQLKTATKLIAVSEATKKDLIDKVRISPKKIEVVHEGVGEEFIVKDKEKSDVQRDILMHYNLAPKTLGKAASSAYFLFVGTIQPRKNLERLIYAFSHFLSGKNSVSRINDRLKMNDEGLMNKTEEKSLIFNQKSLFKLVLVGQKGWKSESIYELPKELGIEDNVRFIGRVSDRELATLYKNALALTFPSLFEGFGLPILEAFASGCPVITSNISSMPEIAGGAALLVDPYNVDSIATAMEKLTKDDALRSSLIKKGIIRAGNFDWEKCAKETLEVILETGESK